MTKDRFSDSVSVQAVTDVNAEQAPKTECSTLDPRVVPVEEGKDLSAANSHGPGSLKIGQLPDWDSNH